MISSRKQVAARARVETQSGAAPQGRRGQAGQGSRRSGESLSARDFESIRSLAYSFCGVDLSGKQVLVNARLSRLSQALGLPSVGALADSVAAEPRGGLFMQVIDALTTNHTSFFREPQHFRFLCDTVVPSVPRPEKIAIWSAACSSGEEPYTLLFSLAEALGEQAFDRVHLLATDISARVLALASRGMYPAAQLSAVPQAVLHRCMLRGTGPGTGYCMVKPEMRGLIQFEQFNLLDSPAHFGPFHAIFCRNVMIYFDKATQEDVVNRLASRLLPGGYLFIGHSESLNGVRHRLEYVAPATYRLPLKAAGPQKSNSGEQGR